MKVFFNSVYVGQTSHQTKTLNPNWSNSNEEMLLVLPIHKTVEECFLELHVYDYDSMSEHDLLGVCTITGSSLRHILLSSDSSPSISSLSVLKESGFEFNSATNSFFVPLGRSNRLKQKISPKGDIEIVVLHHSVSSNPIEVSNKYSEKSANKIPNIRRELDLIQPLEQYLTNYRYVALKVLVSKCLDLVPVSSFSTW